MSWLNNLSVKQKLWLLVAAALTGALLLQLVSAWQTRGYLLDGRKQEIRAMVENAASLVEHYYQQRQALGEQQAQRQAFAALRALRYDDGKGYFWVNDMRLNLLMHPMKPAKEGNNMRQVTDASGQYHWQSMAQVVSQQGGGFVHYTYQGPQFDSPRDKVSYVQAFSPWGWVIGTGVYTQDVQQRFMQLAWQSALTLLVVLVFIVVAAGSVASSITRPLEQMVATMTEVAAGDLQRPVHADQRRDELGVAQRAFASLTATFRQLIQHSQGGNQEITRVIESSAVVSEQTTAGMNRQYAETDSLAAAMDELAATLQEMSGNTSDTSQLTQQVHQQIDDSNQRMQHTVEAVDGVAIAVRHASDVVTKLEQDVKQIDTILAVIRNISEQTNLLALNAAIEAARAGESGRGFAVVADEVRSLAQRTHESTEQIRSMTEGLQAEAQSAVEVMSQSVEQAEQGADFARQTGGSLEHATSNVNAVASRVVQIAEAVAQQGQVVEEIRGNVNSIRDIAQDTRASGELMEENRRRLSGLIQSTAELLQFYQV
ncbi:chemotaxis protein [Bacterioplanes sanyensis]|uniref:methyl-accepting chemotaxis protein n=1 Tax=Bacterioplanes sanyensis TaxID=1249553 RepID=UPI001674EBEB|nr:methyl-accepting chemotaxis protein [Bacterioplanes sanyensis]GGY54691.1 chemotaxis protein [Bacterioplanes sanyensis]